LCVVELPKYIAPWCASPEDRPQPMLQFSTAPQPDCHDQPTVSARVKARSGKPACRPRGAGPGATAVRRYGERPHRGLLERHTLELRRIEASRARSARGRTSETCGGAVMHLAGMMDADINIAINLDSNPPVFDVAHPESSSAPSRLYLTASRSWKGAADLPRQSRTRPSCPAFRHRQAREQ
jgi:hypothetical protein